MPKADGKTPAPLVPISPQVRTLFCLIIGLLAAFVGILNLAQGRPDLAMLYFAFLAYLFVLLIPIALLGSKYGALHPLVFSTLWLGIFGDILRPLPIYAFGLDHHTALIGATRISLSAVITKSLLLHTIGWLSVYVGYSVARKISAPKLSFGKERSVNLKLSIIATLSLTSMYVLSAEGGGIGQLLLERGLTRDQRIGAALGQHWHLISGFLKFACLTWLALRPRVWNELPFWALFALSIAINFVATGSRGGIVLPIAIALIIRSLHRNRLPYAKFFLIGLIGLSVVGVLGEFRSQTSTAKSISDVRVNFDPSEGLLLGLSKIVTRSSSESGPLGIIGRVPHEVALLYGDSYLSIPAALVPSALWPEKPMAGGRLTGQLIFERAVQGGSTPPGSVGEAYWNFHLPGVLSVMCAYGIFLRWIFLLYERNSGAPWATLVYVFSLLLFQPSSSAIYQWLHGLIPALATLAILCGLPQYLGSKRGGTRARQPIQEAPARLSSGKGYQLGIGGSDRIQSPFKLPNPRDS